MDNQVANKLKALKVRSEHIKSDPALRHIPNQHDIAKCSENTKLMQAHQGKIG